MTVKELIEYLSRVEDKNKEIVAEIYDDLDGSLYAMHCEIVYSTPEYPNWVFISNDVYNVGDDKHRIIFSKKGRRK